MDADEKRPVLVPEQGLGCCALTLSSQHAHQRRHAGVRSALLELFLVGENFKDIHVLQRFADHGLGIELLGLRGAPGGIFQLLQAIPLQNEQPARRQGPLDQG